MLNLRIDMRAPTATGAVHAAAQSAPDTLQKLQTQWPGRETQLTKIWEYLCARTARRPLLIHGGPATGKTSLVKSILLAKRQPHAYINAVETIKPRAVAHAILDQLKGKARQRGTTFSAETRGEHLDALPPALEALFPAGGTMACVVIDAAEQLPTALLASLLTCSSANVAWVLISQLAPGTAAFQSGVREMPDIDSLAFDSYASATLSKVLAPWQPSGDTAQRLLGTQLPSLQRVSRSCEDVQLLLRHTHAHLARRRAGATARTTDEANLEADQRRLSPGVSTGRPSLGGGNDAAAAAPGRLPLGGDAARRASLGADRRQSLSRGAGWRDSAAAGGAAAARSVADIFATGMDVPSEQDWGNDMGEEDFQLPRFASTLLVAAFIASRTKEQENRQVFDARARKRRRTGRLTHDKQTEEAHEAKLKGRYAFGLERLLALFWSLIEEQAALVSDGDVDVADSAPPAGELQSAEVLSQLASLVAMRLLSQGSGDQLQGGKYTCNAPEAVVQDMAKRLGLELQQYVQ